MIIHEHLHGMPRKDYNEVVGHAHAIELLYGLLDRKTPITPDDLFSLHRAVQTDVVLDIYQPIGAWKRENNGTNALTPSGEHVFIHYAPWTDVPALMDEWLVMLNKAMEARLSEKNALITYANLHQAFVRIHPFADGNGRLSRLLANLPVMKNGLPPVLIDSSKRDEYIACLSLCDTESGPAQLGKALLPAQELRKPFHNFCWGCWEMSLDLVIAFKDRQKARNAAQELRA